MYAKTVLKSLGGVAITNSVYTQPSQGTILCYDLHPVRYKELTHHTFLPFLPKHVPLIGGG